jgi:death on curing protein
VHFYTTEQVLEFHRMLPRYFVGAICSGGVNMPLLESAVNAPRARIHYDGGDIITVAATYLYHLCKNHCFVDGNKRVATYTATLYLGQYDFILNMPDDELVDLVVAVAASRMNREGVERYMRATAVDLNAFFSVKKITLYPTISPDDKPPDQ